MFEACVAKVVSIAVDKIVPSKDQPRKNFSVPELESLASSIRENGILQPLSVNRNGSNFILIAGERRLRAAKMAGLRKVPCIVIGADEKKSAVLSLVENLQRENLNFYDEAIAIEKIIKKYDMTQEQAAKELGKSQPAVANKLRLLRLPKEQIEMLLYYGLSERHGRALLKVHSDKDRAKLIERIGKQKLSVAKTEEMVERYIWSKADKPIRKKAFSDIRIFINTIDKTLKTLEKNGLHSEVSTSETENYIEYKVLIPKVMPVKKL